MRKEILLLSALAACISAAPPSGYKFELFRVDHFYEVHGIQLSGNCRVCQLDDGILRQLCRQAAAISIDHYQFYVRYIEGFQVAKVMIWRSFRFITSQKSETVGGCRCPTEPLLYLTDGDRANEISFMIIGYRPGDQTKIHGLSLSEWKEYLRYAKKSLRKRLNEASAGSSAQSTHVVYPPQSAHTVYPPSSAHTVYPPSSTHTAYPPPGSHTGYPPPGSHTGYHSQGTYTGTIITPSTNKIDKEQFKHSVKKFLKKRKERKARKHKRHQGGGAAAGEEEEGEEEQEESEAAGEESEGGGGFGESLSEFMNSITNFELPSFDLGDISFE